MGYDCEEMVIYGRLSRHNSEQDRRDDEAWENLGMEIAALIKSDPEYARVADYTWGFR